MPCSWSVGQLVKVKNGKVGSGQVNTELMYIILRNGISAPRPPPPPRILAPRELSLERLRETVQGLGENRQ